MKRTLTILVVGLLVAVLAIGAVAPAVSAHGDTDTEQTPYAEPTDADNATDAYAAAMTQWMQTRMGPDGVEAFEQQTGTSIETVAHAMAEQMGPQSGVWNQSAQQTPYSSGWNDGSQAPGGFYGPQMPHGPHMSPGSGYGPGMFGGQSQGFFGPQGQGFGGGQGFFGGFGNGFGPWNNGPGSYGGGHGMGGHGMSGQGMGGGW